MSSRVVPLLVLVLLGSLACNSNPTATNPTSSPALSPSASACGAPPITPAASAPALVRASMAYDKPSRQFILLGTRNGGKVSETWAWTEASGWQHLAPATVPPARTWGNLAYDDATQQIVLFGGQTAALTPDVVDPLDDTWTWDGTDWTKRIPAYNPPPTIFLPMAYDDATQTVIGVRDNDSETSTSTWQWDGTSWGTIATTGHPAVSKQGAGIAYSSAPSDILLFGTVFGLGLTVDAKTWTFTPNTWTGHVASAGSPHARFFPAMSRETGGGILMFGGGAGLGNVGPVFGDTWSWAHNAWQKRIPRTSPRARSGAVMAYDSNCGRALLYGGEVSTQAAVTYFKDTWLWNGQDWSKVG